MLLHLYVKAAGLAAVLCASALLAQTTAAEWIRLGMQALQKQQFPGAAAAFQKAVDLDPTSLNAHLYLATAYMQQYIPGAEGPENLANARNAETEFLRVLDMEQNNALAVVSLAHLAMNQKRWNESQRWFERAIDIDPQNPDNYYSLGVTDWSRWYPAYGKARVAAGLRPEDPGPIPGPTRTRLKDEWLPTIDDGIANLNKALGIKPDNSDAMAYMNLLIRERADLADTPEQYREETAEADRWMQKAIAARKPQQSAAPRRPIRVDAEVQARKLVSRIDPAYPPLAQQARVSGTVRLEVIVDRDGRVAGQKVLSGHPLLIPAAVEAVKQWTYQPTSIDGEPVEVQTTVDVSFVLPQ